MYTFNCLLEFSWDCIHIFSLSPPIWVLIELLYSIPDGTSSSGTRAKNALLNHELE